MRYSVGMELDPDTCYASLLAKDRRFDGWFYVGVSSTGIYCRPVCAVRAPQQRNCHFFNTAAAAEQAGFRPCLRCRPELAPARRGASAALSDTAFAPSHIPDAAAALIAEGFLNRHDVDALAGRMGVTQRHLRRLFQAAYGVSIVAFAQTQRLLMAKRLLTDTRLPVTAIAHAAGFGSVRRFNDLFQQRYKLSPGRLRKHAPADEALTGAAVSSTLAPPPLVLPLVYRPPYAWAHILDFLRTRVITGVEYADDSSYARALSWPLPTSTAHGTAVASHDGVSGRGGAASAADTPSLDGWFRVTHAPRDNAIVVQVSASLTPVLTQVLPCIRRLFDLDAQPDRIDAHLGALAAGLPGIRVPGAVDGFEMGVRAILGQQVSVAQCVAKLGRFAAAFGRVLSDDPYRPAALVRTFPTVAEWDDALQGLSFDALADRLCPIGMTRMRVKAIVGLAQALRSGTVTLAPLAASGATLHETLAALQALPGVGAWTAHYLAMRVLGWPNAWPEGDGVLLKQTGCASATALREHAACWEPWRAYATMHLWRLAGEADTAAAKANALAKANAATNAAADANAHGDTDSDAFITTPVRPARRA